MKNFVSYQAYPVPVFGGEDPLAVLPVNAGGHGVESGDGALQGEGAAWLPRNKSDLFRYEWSSNIIVIFVYSCINESCPI